MSHEGSSKCDAESAVEPWRIAGGTCAALSPNTSAARLLTSEMVTCAVSLRVASLPARGMVSVTAAVSTAATTLSAGCAFGAAPAGDGPTFGDGAREQPATATTVNIRWIFLTRLPPSLRRDCGRVLPNENAARAAPGGYDHRMNAQSLY